MVEINRTIQFEQRKLMNAQFFPWNEYFCLASAYVVIWEVLLSLLNFLLLSFCFTIYASAHAVINMALINKGKIGSMIQR